MQSTSTLTGIYLVIAAVPVLALVLANGIAGAQSDSSYDDFDEYDAAAASSEGGITPDADDYAGLGKYNPCLFIACE